MAHKTIKTKADLLEWAKRVNMCSDIKTKCDLQDEFGRSRSDDLHNAFYELEDWIEAELPIFAISKAMSHQTYMTYLSIHSNKVADRIFQKMKAEYQGEIQRQRDEIKAEENRLAAFKDQYKALQETVARLESDNAHMSVTIDSLTTENEGHAQAILELTDEIKKYHVFKGVLREFVSA